MPLPLARNTTDSNNLPACEVRSSARMSSESSLTSTQPVPVNITRYGAVQRGITNVLVEGGQLPHTTTPRRASDLTVRATDRPVFITIINLNLLPANESIAAMLASIPQSQLGAQRDYTGEASSTRSETVVPPISSRERDTTRSIKFVDAVASFVKSLLCFWGHR